MDYFNACLPEPPLKNTLFPGLRLPVLPHDQANVSMTDGPHPALKVSKLEAY